MSHDARESVTRVSAPPQPGNRKQGRQTNQLKLNQCQISDALVSLLSSKSAKVRAATVRALKTVASKRLDILNAILPLLDDKAVTVRDDALFVIRNVAATQVDAALFLLPYLRDEKGRVDRHILGPLSKSMPLHKDVRAIMIEVLISEQSNLRDEAWEWLDKNVGALSTEELDKLAE